MIKFGWRTCGSGSDSMGPAECGSETGPAAGRTGGGSDPADRNDADPGRI